MSLYACVFALAVSGQVLDSDRYGNSLDAQSAEEQSADAGQGDPLSGSGDHGSVSPPPRAEQEDPYVVPRSSESQSDTARSLSSNESDGDGVKPSATMRAMLTAPAGDGLSGTAITMNELIAGSSSRAEQLQRINAYWDMCSSIADYYLGLREQDELRRLKSFVGSDNPAWQQAEAELGVRVGTSEWAAIASQHRLANLMRRADEGFLPLPGDMPHCGDYYTRFEQVFAGRSSREAEQLSDLLPLRYEELKDATAAVTRSEQWLDAVANQGSSASDATATLRALELLALRRRAFVQIVRDYNQRIARYAELAAPGPIDADLLIGMLIKRDDAVSTASRSTNTSPESNRQSQNSTSTPPATFTEGWTPVDERRQAAVRDEAVEQASGEMEQSERREHSLLVPSTP